MGMATGGHKLALHLDDGFTYPNGRRALNAIHVDLAAGEFVCVLGPTECGKATLLRIAAGIPLNLALIMERQASQKSAEILTL